MRFNWKSAVGIALSVGLLVYVFRQVPFGEVWDVLRHANIGLLVLAALCATAIFPLRARRWRTILDPVQRDIAFGPLWRSTAIGMMINNVVPARAGELARAYALTREVPGISFSAAFASLAVDRLFDAVVIFGLMFIAMLDPVFPSGTHIAGRPVANWAGTGVLAIVALVALLYAIATFPARLIAIYEAFARRVAPRFEQRGRDLLLAFAAGLSVLRSPRRFAAVMGWTVLHWLCNALAFHIGFRAVGIHTPFSAALFLQGLIAVGVAVPSAPGFFGVFEAFARLGLPIYGVDERLAISWAVGYHLLSFFPITIIGAYYFSRLGMTMSDVQRVERAEPSAAVPLPDETAGVR